MNKFIFVVLFSCVVFSSLFSQETQYQKEDTEVIDFKADKMSGYSNKESEYSKLMGNAEIKTESMEIRADTIELTGKNFRYIKATGNVQGNQAEDNLEFACKELTYDRAEKIALFKGDVVLVDGENEVTAKAQRIEYNENTGVAIMQIAVELTKKDSISTGAFALYYKNEKKLELSGNPQVVQGDDTFRAQEIFFNLETEEITLDGQVRGSVTEKKE